MLFIVVYDTRTKYDNTQDKIYLKSWVSCKKKKEEEKKDICSSWAAWLKAELRQACIRHPTVGTALHIYKQLIIKELYVALQNIRGLIAL